MEIWAFKWDALILDQCALVWLPGFELKHSLENQNKADIQKILTIVISQKKILKRRHAQVN